MAGGDWSRSVRVGRFAVGPEGVIPAAALNPFAGFGGRDVDADALLHLGEGVGADEIDGEFWRPAWPMWVWASLKPGIAKAPFRSMTLVFGGLQFEQVCVGARGEDFSVGDRYCGDFCRGGGWVVGAEVGAGEDVAVNEDGVRRCGLRRSERRDEQECGESEGFHEVECITPHLPAFVQSLQRLGLMGRLAE